MIVNSLEAPADSVFETIYTARNQHIGRLTSDTTLCPGDPWGGPPQNGLFKNGDEPDERIGIVGLGRTTPRRSAEVAGRSWGLHSANSINYVASLGARFCLRANGDAFVKWSSSK